MSAPVIALPVRIIPKPAFGEPCNGCGWCCHMTACALAIDWLPDAHEGQPCPALEFRDGRSGCGLILRPSHYLGLRFNGDAHLAPMIAEALGAGRGCDAEIMEEVE